MQRSQCSGEEFTYAIDSFGPSVYRLAYNQLLSHQAAEDVYQDVFAALFTSQKAFENDYHLKSWLMKVTSNRCKNAKRNFAKRPEFCVHITDETLPDSSVAASAESENTDESPIWEIVDGLSDEFRTVIHLHYVEGYSTEQIAEITGTSATTVRTRLFRARRKIKLAIEGGVEKS